LFAIFLTIIIGGGNIRLRTDQMSGILLCLENTGLSLIPFPCLKDFKARASGPRTIEYKIGEVFGQTQSTT
jgi:hypothetical protein